MNKRPISKKTLQRLPMYLNYLKSLGDHTPMHISATFIAEELRLNDVQVRKDLASVCKSGRPKVGYSTTELTASIEQFLGYDAIDCSVLIGVGNLGRALISYTEFANYGLNIIAAFDTSPKLIDTQCQGKKIYPLSKLSNLCQRMNVRIGIITVPAAAAQQVCDLLVLGGVQAIWNFAPIHLNVPDNVLVQSENMAASLAVLSKHLST